MELRKLNLITQERGRNATITEIQLGLSMYAAQLESFRNEDAVAESGVERRVIKVIMAQYAAR